jgi:hypothetical protein
VVVHLWVFILQLVKEASQCTKYIPARLGMMQVLKPLPLISAGMGPETASQMFCDSKFDMYQAGLLSAAPA